jgi:hypothetical protein
MRSVAATKLVNIAAAPDMLSEVVLLSIRDQMDLNPTYAIDPELCLKIGESLAKLAAEMIEKRKAPRRGS